LQYGQARAGIWRWRGKAGNTGLGETIGGAVKDDVELDYDYLMQKALRQLMEDVLRMVADLGDAPGEHHFYIEFLTQASGVNIPDYLREEYEERMTIVLQHQFQDLEVDKRGFAVSLWFKGKQARLSIPFDAVTSFADPSVQFGLRFERVASAEQVQESERKPVEETVAENALAEPSQKHGDSADIVSLDAFRKK